MNKRTLLLFLMVLSFGGCSQPPPVLGQLPDFSFLDQRGRAIGRNDLKGSVWVADFIYTGCGDVCPMLTQKMGELQKTLQHLPPGVKLVSFTVDPENDTPERLAEYAERFDADPDRWLFLTGPMGEIEKTIEEGFKIAVEKKSAFEIVHGDRFELIDQQGRIRGFYEANPKGMKGLVKGIKQLSREGTKG